MASPHYTTEAFATALARDFGFSILPLGADKRPRGPWSRYQVMAPSAETVAEMGAYAGVVTGRVSGVVVVDTDDSHAEAWAQANLPSTPWMVLTGLRPDGTRGAHRYYRMPEGVDVRNRSNCVGLKIDVRGNGGYVVAPGVLHNSGVTYEPTQSWSPSDYASLPVYDPIWFGESAPIRSVTRAGRPALVDNASILSVEMVDYLRQIIEDESNPYDTRVAAAKAILSIDPTPEEEALLKEMERVYV